MCVLYVLLAVIAIIISSSRAVEVETELGKIKGTILKSRLGADFLAFRGIRYAEPPVGDLRFKNPIPVSAWKPAIFNATNDGPACPQIWNDDDFKRIISEDCLRLNVYTKDLIALRPVIVYLHPGSLHLFSARSTLFGAQHLMDRDVVLVTLNYRLGTLGFMATDTKDAPGNAGLKDQVVALRWIQTHIRKFGGDPNSVTLLGYDAGSLSIGLHMISPMSKGLFHRGIAMNGSPFGQWTYAKHGLKLAKKQAELLKCPTDSVKSMVNCLKEIPMIEFGRTHTDMFEFGWYPILNWLPVIEDDFCQERFLVEHPYKTMISGNIHKVPLITGVTEYGSMSSPFDILINDTRRNWFNTEFDKFAPITFLYEQDTPRSKEISEGLRIEYLQNKDLKMPESMEPLGRLFSDAIIGFGYHRFLDLVSRHVPVYTYLFTYKGRFNHFKYPGNEPYGAVHHDELLYLMRVPHLTPVFNETDPENDIIERLTRMWSQFAKTGNPNNGNDEYSQNVTWKQYTKANKEYLEIGNDLKSKNGGVFENRFAIWDELFPVPDITSLE